MFNRFNRQIGVVVALIMVTTACVTLMAMGVAQNDFTKLLVGFFVIVMVACPLSLVLMYYVRKKRDREERLNGLAHDDVAANI
jgi:low temperature requirement protein LtrA